jgi:uncharacterized membrane protein YhaH (DUF805 family)
MDWGKFLFSFQGRISRKAFWLFFAVAFAVGIALNFLAMGSMMGGEFDPNNPPSIPVWFWLVQIPLFWITIAVYAKRWHDQDKSGWFSLLLLIPLLGVLIVLVMLGFIGGSPGPNRFGEGPMA